MAQSVQNPSRLLYSSNNDNSKYKTTGDSSSSISKINDYADSPSRQVRRSTRVASLSPSSFTPLISDSTMTMSSGTSSASSASSFMPASPSRKYSMMRAGYNGVSIDEIVISDDIVNDNVNKRPPAYPTLRSNPERKHPTLDFQPTNLDTPSTQIHGVTKNTGITPSVKQINLAGTNSNSTRINSNNQNNSNTPAHGILDKLISRGEMEEIAKATPLANYYNKAKAMMPTFGEVKVAEKVSKNIIEPNTNTTSSANSINCKATGTYEMRTRSNNNNTGTGNSANVTPKKQTDNTPISEADTVKVVRTLRNRSIISSPLPATRSSTNLHTPSRKDQPKIDVTVFFRKHQKNLLAYSLLAVFLAATLYHIYDGLFAGIVDIKDTVEDTKDAIKDTLRDDSIGTRDNSAGTIPSIQKDEVVRLIEEKFTETRQNESKLEEKISFIFDKMTLELDEKLSQKLVQNIPVAQDTANAELQRKALDGITSSVKRLEKKLQVLEAKFDANLKEERAKEAKESAREIAKTTKENARQSDITKKTPLPLTVVKHLTTSPLQETLFKSSPFPPENAVSISSSHSPFKFRGDRGKLAVIVKSATEVVLEHPLLPDRSCAPRDFEVWGLPNPLNERDSPQLLLKNTFSLSKESQHFTLLQSSSKTFKVLQLRIRNNHGNDKFTCLYKFKVL